MGPVRFLRAEWKAPNARFVLVWYSINDLQEPLALRLDLDKQVFLDDISIEDVYANRAVKAHARDVVKEVAAYRRERGLARTHTRVCKGSIGGGSLVRFYGVTRSIARLPKA